MANIPFGMPVRIVPEFQMVRRTWRERLLTRPWRPWVARKQVRNPCAPPIGEVFILKDTIICTRSQFELLGAEAKRSPKVRKV